jgi:uncharacterized Zn finger protein (UPF0148 family)
MICALCAYPLVATKNGDSCPRCGVLTFGIKKKKVRLYCPIKKYGETYSTSGFWTSAKYEETNVVGFLEQVVEVDE